MMFFQKHCVLLVMLAVARVRPLGDSPVLGVPEETRAFAFCDHVMVSVDKSCWNRFIVENMTLAEVFGMEVDARPPFHFLLDKGVMMVQDQVDFLHQVICDVGVSTNRTERLSNVLPPMKTRGTVIGGVVDVFAVYADFALGSRRMLEVITHRTLSCCAPLDVPIMEGCRNWVVIKNETVVDVNGALVEAVYPCRYLKDRGVIRFLECEDYLHETDCFLNETHQSVVKNVCKVTPCVRAGAGILGWSWVLVLSALLIVS